MKTHALWVPWLWLLEPVQSNHWPGYGNLGRTTILSAGCGSHDAVLPEIIQAGRRGDSSSPSLPLVCRCLSPSEQIRWGVAWKERCISMNLFMPIWLLLVCPLPSFLLDFCCLLTSFILLSVLVVFCLSAFCLFCFSRGRTCPSSPLPSVTQLLFLSLPGDFTCFFKLVLPRNWNDFLSKAQYPFQQLEMSN